MGRTRFGTPAEIVRFDIHAWDGRLIDRIKAKTTEKSKGIAMIDRAKQVFGITDNDISDTHRNRIIEEVEEHKKLFDKSKPIVWKRDDRGNII